MRFWRWLLAGGVLVCLGLARLSSAPVGPPRLVRGPYLQTPTETSVIVVWNTDEPTDTRLDYGGEAGTQTVSAPGATLRHQVRITGLRPGTRYQYRVVAAGHALREGLSFTTNKPAGSPFRFLVFGDSGSGEPGQYALARRMQQETPDFLVHVGDVVYNRGEQSHYDARFFRPYAALLERIAIWPSLGNHDVITQDGAPYLENFVLPRNGPAGVTPERNYSFDYADAHFAAIDSDLSEATLRDKVAPWLARDLAASTRRWKFVFFHHPPYSSGLHGENPRVQRTLVPVITRARVAVVFNGHDHTYERIRPMAGVTYIVTGAGGNGLYRHAHPHDYTARFYNRSYSFTEVNVNGNRLEGRQVTTNGEVVDQWGLSR